MIGYHAPPMTTLTVAMPQPGGLMHEIFLCACLILMSVTGASFMNTWTAASSAPKQSPAALGGEGSSTETAWVLRRCLLCNVDVKRFLVRSSFWVTMT